jgi:hypothetical protein
MHKMKIREPQILPYRSQYIFIFSYFVGFSVSIEITVYMYRYTVRIARYTCVPHHVLFADQCIS